MTISLQHRLAYVNVRITHGQQEITLSRVVIDTGSSGTAAPGTGANKSGTDHGTSGQGGSDKDRPK